MSVLEQQLAAASQKEKKNEVLDRVPRYQQPRGDVGKSSRGGRSAKASNAEAGLLQQRRDARRPPHSPANATSNQRQQSSILQGRQRSVANGRTAGSDNVKTLPSRRNKANVTAADFPVLIDLEQTDLAKLFGTEPSPKSSTDLRTQSILECHGGDYSRYISGELSETTNTHGPLQKAQLVLARKRDVGMRSRSRILNIVKGSVAQHK
jgi:hypothetical protein